MEKKYRKLLTDFRFQATSEIYTRKHQFEQWIKQMFFLNEELNKEYNSIYQDLFWVKIYQLLTEGDFYLRDIKKTIDKGNSFYIKKWYDRLLNGLIEIKTQFREIEFEYLQYRRHNVCHIFQHDYSVFNKDYSLKSIKRQKRKDKSIINSEIEYFSLLKEYGGDEGYDKHYRNILYPIINILYHDLQEIHEKEIKANISENNNND